MNTYKKIIGKFWKEISNSQINLYIGTKWTQSNTVNNEFES